jgi:hypothetical protein
LSEKDLAVREGDRVLLLVEADLDKPLADMVLDLGDDGGRLVLERAAKGQSESKD